MRQYALVILHFAETYWTQTNQRVFNVNINGTAALTNFDIFAKAGAANKAVTDTLSATANPSGQIVIQFATVKDNAQVNAIEIN
jgi:beta-galactosidase